MDANNGILCPVPEDERTPFVDVLLKVIEWQKTCIESTEKENNRLKEELIKLKKQNLDENTKKNFNNTSPPKKSNNTPKRKKIISPIKKIQKQGSVNPENVQQLLVKNIQQLLVNIGSRNKRQFTRLHIHLDADLNFGSHRYNRHPVENISLGGLYVNGNFNRQLGDICTVTLNHSELDANLEIHATCSVIRSDGQGVGLEFISMKLDDFCHLQTVLLYQADDPVILGTEFVNNVNLELEGDLLLCKSFSFQKDQKTEE